MRELEARWPHEIAVVGVHSGKYLAERVTSRIRDACARLDVSHAVLNDRQFRVWRAYAVNAWPTLVAVDPAGYVTGMRAGEFTVAQLEPFVEHTLADARARGLLHPAATHLEPDPPSHPPGTLRYPGKVAVAGERIAIADTGHHRVLVARLDPDRRSARIELAIGGGARGFRDGHAAEAALDAPQGLTFGRDARGDELLWIADTANHAIRVARLDEGTLRTVSGIGRRVRTRAELEAGGMASPWDLALAGGELHVAMAGTHQLWSASLAAGEERGARMTDALGGWGSSVAGDVSSLLGGGPRARTGSGAEALHDGPHARAALAQPMGLALDDARRRLWFADAESSAVRWADLDPSGAVGTIVGTGLFDFGDRDGEGDDVRLQHPQGIALLPGGRLLLADSYNDALRIADPDTRRVVTWLRGFAEPGGLCVAGGLAFVADTVAHRIAVVRLDAVSEDQVWGLAIGY